MKKIAKLSLATVVALASTSAFAGDNTILGDNTTISGKLYVEQTISTSDTVGTQNDGDSSSAFEIDYDFTLKTKVTDTLTAVVNIEGDTQGTAGTNVESQENGANSSQALQVSNAYFTYAPGKYSVSLGRTDINTPNTDGEEGEGVWGTYSAGPVTIAGAHFTTNDADAVADTLGENDISTSDINAAAIMGSFEGINLEAWYVSVSDVADNYTYVASTSIEGFDLSARYATTDYDTAYSTGNLKDGDTLILTAGTKIENASLRAKYLSTDKEGEAMVTDPSSANTAELVHFTANKADASAWLIGGSYPLTSALTAHLDYGKIDFNNGNATEDDASEIVAKLTYAFSKNAVASVRYADYNEQVDSVETDKSQARVDLTYKF